MDIDWNLLCDTSQYVSLEIKSDPLNHLARHVQRRWRDQEAGGQLFATISGQRWTIVRATGPRQSDWRSRFGFRPDRHAERLEIEKLFAEGLHYVGDWHTHPENTPRPSSTDIKSICDTVQQSTHSLPGFIMLIAGRNDFPDGLWASFHNLKGQMYPLKLHMSPQHSPT